MRALNTSAARGHIHIIRLRRRRPQSSRAMGSQRACRSREPRAAPTERAGRGLRCAAPRRLASLHDARRHQLLDLLHDLRVLHVFLGRLGVILEVLQHLAHDRVREDALDLWISHGARLSLLQLVLVQLPAVGGAQLLQATLDSLLQLCALRVLLQPQLVRFHRLGVLLGEELRVGFPTITLGEVGLELDALVRVLLRLGQRAELRVAGGAVRVELVALLVHRRRPAPDGLRVALDGLRELLLLEHLVTLLLLLVAQVHVDILILLLLLQRALRLVQARQRFGVPVLQQGVLVDRDGGLQLPLRSQRVALAGHGARHKLVVREQLAPALDGLGAHLDALVEVLHLVEHRRLVGEEADVGVVQIQRGVVALDGRVKLLLLVVVVALGLVPQRLLLAPLLGLLLIIQLRLRLWLRLWCPGGRRRRRAGALLLTAHTRGRLVATHHLHAQPHRQRLHHARVLHVGAEAGGVGLDALQHGHEVGLLQEPAGLGVHGQLGHEVGRAEHGADAAARARRRRLLRGLQAALERGVAGVQLQALLVRLHGLLPLLEASICGANARVALRPFRFELNHLVGILQRFLVLLQAGLAGRAIAVQHMVGCVQLDGGGEVADRFREAARREGGVTLGFELVRRHRGCSLLFVGFDEEPEGVVERWP
mmetsp:Transcript_27852/g.70045  ORF Transcript_27852/g.70045 Transcript_27852/m.70045 type:complete len:653 (-) Transcript_27852:147-2105(-)